MDEINSDKLIDNKVNQANPPNTADQAKTENSPNFQTNSDDEKKGDKNNLPESDGNKNDEKKPPQFSKLDKLIGYIGFALIMMAFLPFLGAVAGFPIPDFIPKVPLEVGYGLGIPMAGFSAYKFVKYKNDQINQNQVAPDNTSQFRQNEKGKDLSAEMQLDKTAKKQPDDKSSKPEVDSELHSKIGEIAKTLASRSSKTTVDNGPSNLSPSSPKPPGV